MTSQDRSVKAEIERLTTRLRALAAQRQTESREANHAGNQEMDAYRDGQCMALKDCIYELESLLSALIAEAPSQQELAEELVEAREQRDEAEANAIESVVSHWFIQGGASQFGPIDEPDTPSSPDEVIAAILRVVRAQASPRSAPATAEMKLCQICGVVQPCHVHGRTPVTAEDFAELSREVSEALTVQEEQGNERQIFERLSRVLTGGNAATWDQVIDAAERLAEVQSPAPATAEE